MAVPDTGCRWEKRRFSWQSQMLVGGEAGVLMAVPVLDVGGEGRGGCSHFSSRCWLWEEGDSRFSWQS